MKEDKIVYFVGNHSICAYPMKPFDELILEFLNELSRELRNDQEAKLFTDVLSFAFFCRRANLNKIKSKYDNGQVRYGRGLAFHIAPSNVPVNFAFSLVFGLLAGNSNVVRASSKRFKQTEIICRILNKLLEIEKYEMVKKLIAIVSYEHDFEVTDYYSGICNARIIWGGDASINEIKKSPLPIRAVEILFSDRYSFALIDTQKIAKLSDTQMLQLADKFYNDTYLMDQNACSTPHLIVWKTSLGLLLDIEIDDIKKRFWNAVSISSQKYDLTDIKASDKYTDLCEKIIGLKEVIHCERYGNQLYVLKLERLPEQLDSLRGKYGEFFEIHLTDLDEFFSKITPKVQTCLIYGMDKEEVLQSIYSNHITGIDRIVPIGYSLDMDVYWDGYDVISSLSRIIN